MEPVASVVDKLKDFAKSSQDLLARGILHWPQNFNRRNPIEILKRLQREAFSDIMKLRDRQDKVERMLTFYKTSKATPFQEASTRVRGDIDVVGAMFMVDNFDDQQHQTVQNAGIRTGVDLKLVFETVIREKDMLVAEFVAVRKDQGNTLERPLSLGKLLYSANVSDWFSAVAIPMGATCSDVAVDMSSFHKDKGFSEYSAYGPPFLNQKNGSALGIMVKKSNVVASLAQFVSGLGLPTNCSEITNCFGTFGQVVYQLSQSTKLSLLGVHKVPKLSNQRLRLGAMTTPFSIFRQRKLSETSIEENGLQIETYGEGERLDGSVALMLESELDESTRIGGWIEMKQSNTRHLQWAVSMSDTPEDDLGWGLSMGGLVQGSRSWDYFQVEAFLNFSFGKRFRFQPAVVYLADRTSHFPAFLLRSSWSL
ncbi:uncharacterized protein LOC113749441 isoform X1 [Coffea eugenioides]|uniref:uncharacterized protein LOC113749441 isoform X1 n=2 Tax=Coffea eugenioides TaxID=49369 RepID=UPI000F6087C5|nr:uncharacterized protein LOC113749441 isoform X1 [Coffea eugenioides]